MILEQIETRQSQSHKGHSDTAQNTAKVRKQSQVKTSALTKVATQGPEEMGWKQGAARAPERILLI
jgi:hypothetical protein